MSSKNNCHCIRERPRPASNFPFLYPTNVPSQTTCTCEEGPPSIIFGNKCPLPNIEQEDLEYKPRPLYALGLVWIEILRKVLIPTSSCGIAVSVVQAKSKEEPKPLECDPDRKLVRACDLPLYDEKPCVDCMPKKEDPPSLFMDTIRCAREELWVFVDQAKAASGQMAHYYKGIKGDAQYAIEFLREESNLVPRMGAIAVGGLTGFILGLRRGVFKRLLYTGAGAAAMASLCYPKEAAEYAEEGIRVGKKYFIISYHFLNGVTRDLTGYQLPPLPSGHLVISDGHHHHHHHGHGHGHSHSHLEAGDAVPPSAHLLPPTANATHIPMPHEERSEEMKKQLRDQSNPDDKDMYPTRT